MVRIGWKISTKRQIMSQQLKNYAVCFPQKATSPERWVGHVCHRLQSFSRFSLHDSKTLGFHPPTKFHQTTMAVPSSKALGRGRSRGGVHKSKGSRPPHQNCTDFVSKKKITEFLASVPETGNWELGVWAHKCSRTSNWGFPHDEN